MVDRGGYRYDKGGVSKRFTGYTTVLNPDSAEACLLPLSQQADKLSARHEALQRLLVAVTQIEKYAPTDATYDLGLARVHSIFFTA